MKTRKSRDKKEREHKTIIAKSMMQTTETKPFNRLISNILNDYDENYIEYSDVSPLTI